MSLPDALELAASELSQHADAVRDANGDPDRLLETLSAGAASEVLSWLLSNETRAGEELALAWSESDRGARPLQSLDAGSLAKPGRKALRKALHRLRSRGVEVESAQPTAVVARLPEIDESIEAALVSALDPRGSRMAYLVASHPAGGARIYEAVLDDVRGIVEFSVYDTGRSKARKFLRELSGRARGGLIEIEPNSLRALLVHAAEQQPADRPAPRSFVEHRSQLGLEAAGTTPADQVAAALGGAARDETGRLDRLVKLVRERELGPWPPPLETLRRVAEPLSEETGGKLIISGAAKQERRIQLLAGAAADIFDQSFAQATATRLRETAFVLWRSEREEDAQDCLAGAAAVEASAADNPVSLALVEVWFGQLFDESPDEDSSGEDSSDDETSLLVKP
jgi:hypothetical protein